jgi:hypothetical protein
VRRSVVSFEDLQLEDSARGVGEAKMEAEPGQTDVLVNHVESAIEEINSAVVAASELGLTEVEPWLEWISEELGDLLLNLLQTPSQAEKLNRAQ